MRPGCRVVRLPESVEYIRKKLGRNPHSSICDTDFDEGVYASYTNVDCAALWSELDCIRQEIPDRLLQPGRISFDGPGIHRNPLLEFDRFRVSGRTQCFDRSFDERSTQLKGLHFEAQFPGDNATHVEQFIDQHCLPSRSSFYSVQALPPGCFVGGLLHQLRPAKNGIQWCPQLV